MKAFLSAVVLSLIIAVGAAYVLDGSFQQASSDAYTSINGVRLGDPGHNLIGF
jgi:uncharacterized membrane protein